MKILMCTNGEKYSEEAIEFSANLFKLEKPEVVVLNIKSKNQKSENCLKRAIKILDNYKIKAQTKTMEGNVSEEILRESEGYDLVVLGSRPVSNVMKMVGGITVNENIENIIQKIKTSLLVVKEPRNLRRVLICTDGSKAAENAINFWGKLKKDVKPTINIINVVPEMYSHFKDYLETISEEQLRILGTLPGKRTDFLFKGKKILSKYNIDAKIKLREGHSAEEILKESERDYDLIVMGYRGRKVHKKSIFGRQTIKVIRGSEIPVLVIK